MNARFEQILKEYFQPKLYQDWLSKNLFNTKKNILKFKMDSTVSDLYNIKRLMRPEFMKRGTEVNKETDLMNISRIS